jgi:tungstate transport system substrate-binding protein
MRARFIAVILLCDVLAGCTPAPRALTLATTTSVGNSGLLERVLTAYESHAGMIVHTHLVGSGRALAMLAAGQADVAITHAPAAETAALREHPSWQYVKFMFNDFVIVGPTSDPAGTRAAASAADAMARIARSDARFISRGDESGTHEREQALWKSAGVTPAGDRLVVAGAGMGATLRIAGETASYTLTDRATYSQQQDQLPLAIVYENESALLNTYALVFDPHGPLASDAQSFATWLVDGAGRDLITSYRVGPGIRAFEIWPPGRSRTHPADQPR